jgi:shikimate dehydrogenase
MTRHIGLIGYPLKHSVSAAFQQAAFDYYKLDIRYQTWETKPNELDAIVERLRQPDTLGANVTVHHKEAIMSFLNIIEPPADQIGAVNTIIKAQNKLVGYNTDALGFMRALRGDVGFDPIDKKVVILGAGGAARAVSFTLIKSGIAGLTIIDVSPERVRAISQHLTAHLDNNQKLSALTWDLTAPLDNKQNLSALTSEENSLRQALGSCDLIVNCTTIGMKHSKDEGKSPVNANLFTRDMLVCDLVYNPLETPLLKMAAAAGAKTLAGLPMLIYQGAAAFELWTARQAPVDVMFQAARGALEV